jgi:DNA-binding Lrp family transcriptional regulator
VGAVVNWRAIGQAGTLVVAHIENDDLPEVVEAVNDLEGVSHNYLRGHHFNLWFTLWAQSETQIIKILAKLSRRFGADFHSLPVVRVFKLDVRFDARSGGLRLLPFAGKTIRSSRVLLDRIDKRILAGLQNGLEAVAQPFNFLCVDGTPIEKVLSRLDKMIGKWVIHRIGAVVGHHKLGFIANAMFVCKAESWRIVEIGENLAKLNIVSHCYQRRPFEGWPFNIFGMMHSRDVANIRREIEKFVKANRLTAWDVLETAKTLKK